MFPNGKDMTVINNNKTSHREKKLKTPPAFFSPLNLFMGNISTINWFTTQITVFEWCVQTITCLQLTMETLEKGVKHIKSHWCRSGVFNVNFEQYFTPFSIVYVIDFEYMFVCWDW